MQREQHSGESSKDGIQGDRLQQWSHLSGTNPQGIQYSLSMDPIGDIILRNEKNQYSVKCQLTFWCKSLK